MNGSKQCSFLDTCIPNWIEWNWTERRKEHKHILYMTNNSVRFAHLHKNARTGAMSWFGCCLERSLLIVNSDAIARTFLRFAFPYVLSLSHSLSLYLSSVHTKCDPLLVDFVFSCFSRPMVFVCAFCLYSHSDVWMWISLLLLSFLRLFQSHCICIIFIFHFRLAKILNQHESTNTHTWSTTITTSKTTIAPIHVANGNINININNNGGRAPAKRFVNMHVSSNICTYNKDLFYLRNKLLYLWFGHWRPRNKLCFRSLSLVFLSFQPFSLCIRV